MDDNNRSFWVGSALTESINDLTAFHRKTISPIIQSIIEVQNTFNTITEAIKNIQIPDIDFDIDLESTRKEIDSYAKYGWTMTPSSDFVYSIKLDNTIDEKIQYDEYFYKEFNDKSIGEKSIFENDKEYSLDQIQSDFKDLLEECYLNYEMGNYKVIIPTLISIIEGQIAILLDTNLIGGKLISKWKSELDESDYTGYLIGLSTVNFLKNSLFVTRNFSDERLPGLNRNWVLHGRDNPQLWTKIDAMKLFVNLSTVLFVKEYAEIEV